MASAKHLLRGIHILNSDTYILGASPIISPIGLEKGHHWGVGEKSAGLFGLFCFYLDGEWQSIFFESIKIKNKLLSSFSQRGQISIAININGFSFQNLSKQQTKVNKTSFHSRSMHINIL